MEKINLNNLGEDLKIDFSKMLKDAFVDVNDKLKEPPIAVSIGSHTYNGLEYPNSFGTYGNFSCIVGASKSRKSFFKSMLIASYIGGNSIEYAPSFRTHRDDNKLILDFDTEQSEYHSQRVFKRVCDMVGSNAEIYKPFSLRRYTHKERLEFIEWCILESDFKDSIGFVSIDGVADLVADVNDLKECNSMVQKLMTWTDISKCHLSTILHTNFGSSKPTGHLGSAVMKKAETVCFLEYGIEATSVQFKYTRGFPVDDFAFNIGSDGFPRVQALEMKNY